LEALRAILFHLPHAGYTSLLHTTTKSIGLYGKMPNTRPTWKLFGDAKR